LPFEPRNPFSKKNQPGWGSGADEKVLRQIVYFSDSVFFGAPYASKERKSRSGGEQLARRSMAKRWPYNFQPAAKAAKAVTSSLFVSPTHKRIEGRSPVWGSEFTSKVAALQGGRRNCC
jgi:hypothetical protein